MNIEELIKISDTIQNLKLLGIQSPMLEELVNRQKRRFRKPKKEKAHNDNRKDLPGGFGLCRG